MIITARPIKKRILEANDFSFQGFIFPLALSYLYAQ